jgi:hypothetical protein
LSRFADSLALLLLHVLFNDTSVVQAIDGVLHVLGPLYRVPKQRNDSTLYISIAGGGLLTMQQNSQEEGIGARLYRAIRLLLILERMAGFGLHSG